MNYRRTMGMWAFMMAFTLAASMCAPRVHAVQDRPAVEFSDKDQDQPRGVELLVPAPHVAIYYAPAPNPGAVAQADGPDGSDDTDGSTAWVFWLSLSVLCVAVGLILLALPWSFPGEADRDVPRVPDAARLDRGPRAREEGLWRNLLRKS